MKRLEWEVRGKRISAGERKQDWGGHSVICLVYIVLQRKCTWGAQRKHNKLHSVLLIHNLGLSSSIHTSHRESSSYFAHIHSHMEIGRTNETHIHATPNVSQKPLIHWVDPCLNACDVLVCNQFPVYAKIIIKLSSGNAPQKAITATKSRNAGKHKICFLNE